MTSARNADALALPARELSGIGVIEPLRQSDEVHEPLYLGAALLGAADAVHNERRADDGADAPARIERGIGVLEHRLHATCQERALKPPIGRPSKKISPAEGGSRPSSIRASVDLAQPDFADDAQDLAAPYRQGDAYGQRLRKAQP
jgi:hypothetical protein